MRPLMVIVLTITLFGGMKWFLHKSAVSSGEHSHAGVQLIQASGAYGIDLSITFDAGPDEFALSDVSDAPSLLVQMNGEEVLRRTDTVSADQSPIQIPSVKGVVVGTNEFFIQASPSDMSSLTPGSARIRITRDGHVVSDKTIWSEAGEILQGTAVLEVPSDG